ncbi:MAG: T9SS type A sorting domain-containing protein [FCB group bacterium]
MKKITNVLVIIIIIVCTTNIIFSNDCLKMELPNDGSTYGKSSVNFNPDSVMIDTCTNSPTYNLRFVKNFNIISNDYFFITKPLVEGNIYTIYDIDSINYFEFYTYLKELENKYGNITFKRSELPIDSVCLKYPEFQVFLNDYFCFDSLKFDLIDSIEIKAVNIRKKPEKQLYYAVPISEIGLVPRMDIESIEDKIFLHGVDGTPKNKYENDRIWVKNYHPLGFHWNIYTLKCPLAWEITTGNFGNSGTLTPITIALSEWDDGNHVFHKEFSNGINNYKYNFLCTQLNGNIGDIDLSLKGGNKFSSFLNTNHNGHPIQDVSEAIAPIDGNPMVGTAPNAQAMLLQTWQAYLYDTDQNLTNDNINVRHIPDIISSSTGAGAIIYPYTPCHDYGIVEVAAGGNNLDDSQGNFGTLVTINDYPTLGITMTEYQPIRHEDTELEDKMVAKSALLDPDGKYDIKPIVVGAISNGRKNTCSDNLICGQWPSHTWANDIWVSSDVNPHMEYAWETYAWFYDHSRDYVKFPRRPITNPPLTDDQWRALRIRRKVDAEFDVSCPALGLLAALDDNPTISCNYNTIDFCNPQSMENFIENCTSAGPQPDHNSNYGYDFYQWVDRLVSVCSYFTKYTTACDGNSASAPQVAGIVALMLTINKFMGLEASVQNGIYMPNTTYNGNIIVNEPADVHRRVYDILTFTAKKVRDFNPGHGRYIYTKNGIQYGSQYSGYFTYHDPLTLDVAYNRANRDPNEEYHFDYDVQNNYLCYDRLRRSWAQRMGFGMVDAYRAVAHSIANKGEYQYHEVTQPPTIADHLNFLPSGPGNVTPDGQHLLHLGAHVKIGTGEFELNKDLQILPPTNDFPNGIKNCPDCPENDAPNSTTFVLNYSGGYFTNPGEGGVSLPGENHNNQGVTKIIHSNCSNPQRISLSVGNNNILAIDGILTTSNTITCNQSNLRHNIYTTGTGKILMEGYLKNIQLRGNLRISDLLLESTGPVIVNTNPLSYETSGGLYFEGSAYSSEIYGKIYTKIIQPPPNNFNNAIIQITSGKLTLMPGAEIHLDGSKDLYLIGGETHLQSATGIYATATEPYKQIHVLSGAKLIVDNNAKVEIYPSIIVENGGELDLMNNSITQLAHFWIKPGGTFHIYPGAYLIFLPNPMIIVNMINSCQGNFIAEGTPQDSIFIYGSSNFCSDVPQTADVTGRDYISLFGDPNVNYKSVHLKYCSVENVSIYTHEVMFDAPINSIEHNKFAFTRTLSCYSGIDANPANLLSVSNYPSFPIINNDIPFYATINDNLFIDYAGITTVSPREEADYIGNGLTVDDYSRVTIYNNTFKFIQFEAFVYGNDWVQVGTSNTFISSYFGVLTYNNAKCLLLCNYFNDNMFGYVNDNTYSGVYGNQFLDSRLAMCNFSNQNSVVIGNLFETYLNGILINNGNVYVGRDNDGFILGNTFNNLISNNHYLTDGSTNSDVDDIYYIEPKSGSFRWLSNHLIVQNGRNIFNAYINEDKNFNFGVQDPDPTNYIPVSINQFPLNNSICTPKTRPEEVYAYGFDLCHSEAGLYDCNTPPIAIGEIKLPPPPDIPPDTTSTSTIPFSTQGGCMDSSYFSRDGWAYYISTGDVNDSLHNDAEWNIPWLMDNTADTIPPYCRFENAQMAFHCIVLGNKDSIYNRLTTLNSLIDGFELDSLYPMDIASHFISLKAQIFNKLHQLDSALYYLNMVVNIFPNTNDSIPANWEILRINAELADTTHGAIYDSLMLVFQDRVVLDLRRFPSATLDSMRPIRSSVPFDYNFTVSLGQNIPNPFADETTIPYSLSWEANIKLSVYDVFGREVAILASGIQSAGKHSVIFKTSGYDNGIYFYKLEAPSVVLIKKMMLIR